MNTGTREWTDRWLACMDAEAMTASNGLVGGVLMPDERRVPVPRTRPGATVIVGVGLTAPELPGTVRSEWKMVDAQGRICFPEHAGVYCQVRVMRI